MPQVGHAGEITAAAFALDGKVIVSSSRDNVVKLWNAEDGALLQTIVGAGLVAVGRGGGTLLTAEPGGLVLRDLRSGRSVPLKTGPVPTESYSGEYGAQAVAFSTDGERLFRVGPDPGPGRQKKSVGIQVWNLSGAGHRFIPLSGDYDYAKAIFSSDGALLIAHNSDEYLPNGGVRKKPGMVRALKAETGAEVYSFAMPSGEKVAEVYLSPDNRFLVTQSEREVKGSGFSTTVIFYDARTGRELHRFRREGTASKITFSPGSDVFASVSNKDKGAGKKTDSSIIITDAMTGRPVRELQVGETRTGVESISFSPDGKTITASFSADDELEKDSLIQLWDVASGKRLRSLHSRSSEAGHMTYSPDGSLLASWGAFYSPQSIEVWDVARGKGPLDITGQRGELQSVDISPDGKLLALGEQSQVRLWSLTTGAPLAKPVPGNFRTFSRDGSMLVLEKEPETGEKRLTVVSETSGAGTRSFEGGFLSLSNNGQRIFTTSPQDAGVMVWDTGTGKMLRRLGESRGSEESRSFAVSPDGQYLAAADQQKIDLIEVETGRVLKTLNWPDRRASKDDGPENLYLTFSPDGKMLAGVYGVTWNEHTTKMWRVPTGTLLFRANTGLGAGVGATFSPDGKMLATTGNQIETWDARTGRRQHLLDVSRYVFETAEYGTSAYFSPDGKVLAGVVGGGRQVALLWDAATGRALPLLREPLDESSAVGFSPDMRHAVSVGRDGTVKFWRLSDGRLMATLLLLGRDGWLAMRPDGFVDGSADARGRLRWRRSSDLMDVVGGDAYYEQYHAPRLLADIFAAGK